MSKIKLYDKVRIKSKDIIGFVVDVLNDKEKFIVEKKETKDRYSSILIKMILK